MKVKRALIQAEDGVPASDVYFRAWDGLRKLGVPCERFEPQQLRQGTLPLSRETLVAGGVSISIRAPALPSVLAYFRLDLGGCLMLSDPLCNPLAVIWCVTARVKF